METVIQVRLPKAIVKEIEMLVEKGFYSNKSEVMRDAARRLFIEKHIGIIPNTGDSVKEIRELRKRLTKEDLAMDKVNALIKK
jgi:Arc/MetJ-type ribon-helix-helix transcriptional regulator